ncbi:MAG: L-seryl-tRNA(Sec) selenium transferase [Roseibacillus sp.]|nr:L-seryl-tRNA(Sec) selenium transferase [Roseibacillus sp.]HAO96190.1 L-seryl-tRNA(Sec) selenium transferase [Verrucomicrobiales bacterium]|tara:strand:+ start:3627 stop:4997 length:1371 start_codon:yes stop_codon:yes gene_type:complete
MPDFRQLPSVETLSKHLTGESNLPRPLVTGFVKRRLAEWRTRLAEGEVADKASIEQEIQRGLQDFSSSRLQPVINATGVIIHTNLGRSPLGQRASETLSEIATGYSNLEFNLLDGKRGKRAGYLETALAVLLETEAATAVNNCAAALVLTLRTLISSEKNEVIVSRGELVEIGGGFRIPEVLETSGAKLVEVGATNKTHLKDYANAISNRTALILKVHRSNFYLEGFTDEPDVTEISALAHDHGIPLVEDLGSGAVMHTDQLAPIDHEPTPQDALRNGIDLVIFSGDKLLGGPQAGVIAGNADLVGRIKSEPFFRAVRCDKLILTVLQECIDDYLACKGNTKPRLPVLDFLSTPVQELRVRAEKISSQLKDLSPRITIVEALSRTGGGTMPRAEIPSIALQIESDGTSLKKLAHSLRRANPAVVGYVSDDTFLLNLRTVFPSQDQSIVNVLLEVLR